MNRYAIMTRKSWILYVDADSIDEAIEIFKHDSGKPFEDIVQMWLMVNLENLTS